MGSELLGGKRLAVFLDGTWNTVGDNTNVWRLKALCADRDADGKKQVTYYDVGVNGFFGGMVGKGLLKNITDAYEWLVDNYDDGDEIYVFGFSRGAYTARSLAGMIAICGLIARGAPLGVQQIYQRYRTEQDRTIRKLLEEHKKGTLKNLSLEERWMINYSRPVDIKMIGVWDTVGSHGVPWFSIQGVSSSSFSFLQTGLRIPILNGYHALAIDEHRKAFSPTLWTVKKYDDATRLLAMPRSVDVVEQVGSPGTELEFAL